MKPTPFYIEIPERPIYQPGSGPAMAPITLQPDDTDTGWVIAGTVEFQGVSQYVVTPVDNPTHRRPVRKEHILRWVSPKAYEDFEFAEYKRQTEAEEWEKDNLILANDMAAKKKKHGKGLARKQVGAKASFQGFMQLEDNVTATPTEQLSSPEHSENELSSEVLQGRAESAKRKRSVGFPQRGREPVVKRRALSNPSSLSLLHEASLLKYRQEEGIKMPKGDNDEKGEDEVLIDSIEQKRPARFDRPILPLQKLRQASLAGPTSGRAYVSPYSTPTRATPPIKSLKTSPNLHWNALQHPTRASPQIFKSAASRDAQRANSAKSVTSVHQSNHGRDHPPILPVSLSRPAISKPTSTPVEANGTGEMLVYGEPKSLGTRSMSRNGETKFQDGRSIIKGLESSRITPSRGRRPQIRDETEGRKKNLGSRSSSSRSSAVFKGSSGSEGEKVTKQQAKYFASMMMDQGTKQEVKDSDDGENDGLWDVHGILDDELLPIDGRLVRHYLCVWVGDYDTTWEPEENVSAEAIEIYEKKKRRRSSYGFDGAMDIDMNSENGEAWDKKDLHRFDDIQQESDNEETSSEVFTPNENIHSGAGSVAREGQEDVPKPVEDVMS